MRRSSVVPMPKTQRRASKKEEAKGKGSEGSKGKRKSRQRHKARIGACFYGGRTIIQSIRTIVWTTATICRYRSTICICEYRCCFNCRECPPQISKRLDF